MRYNHSRALEGLERSGDRIVARYRENQRGGMAMAVFTRPEAEIHYEVHGSGYPLLLFAPGGLRSQLAFWRHSPGNPDAAPPWMILTRHTP